MLTLLLGLISYCTEREPVQDLFTSGRAKRKEILTFSIPCVKHYVDIAESAVSFVVLISNNCA